MTYINKLSIFINTLLIFSIFFLVFPDIGYSGVSLPPTEPTLPSEPTEPTIPSEPTEPTIPSESTELEVTNVPVLSQWGLIATAGLLGFIGFIVIRRKKATV